jgi:predicted Rossmann fold flavoprotein
MKNKNIVIIGGGAAGFFCAVNCARLNPKANVILLEKTSKLLSKVRVSGGGRCNVTHNCFENYELVKNYPRGEKELHSSFDRFSVTETINWFEERGVKLKTEEDGRMFPVTNTSETIINCLIDEALRHKVDIRTNSIVDKITPDRSTNTFALTLADGDLLHCDKLLIATGGSPKESGYDWLQELGHSIVKPVPSLFTFNIPNKRLTALMGVSVPQAKVKIVGHNLEYQGPLLITHWGLSGPVILKLSAWGAKLLNDSNYNFNIHVSWITNLNEEKLRSEFDTIRKENIAKLVFNTKPFDLPKRLWEYLLYKAEVTNELRWADMPKKKLNVLINSLISDEYKVSGKTTFKEEFVTCGGINLKEIDFKTMQSTIVPNLYFAGEVLNIDGITGGFNFQNAWTTGWLAAVAMVK